MPRERWSEAKYTDEAYKRAKSIVKRIVEGEYPMGHINLLSGLPEDVIFPTTTMAQRIAGRIWQQLLELQDTIQAMESYNLEVSVEKRGKPNTDQATVRFTFSPDDVRKLSKPDESGEV